MVLRDQEDLSAHDIESIANRQTGAVILFFVFFLPRVHTAAWELGHPGSGQGSGGCREYKSRVVHVTAPLQEDFIVKGLLALNLAQTAAAPLAFSSQEKKQTWLQRLSCTAVRCGTSGSRVS